MKNYIHEDELPNLSDNEYNELYKTSYILDIVRVFIKSDVDMLIQNRNREVIMNKCEVCEKPLENKDDVCCCEECYQILNNDLNDFE